MLSKKISRTQRAEPEQKSVHVIYSTGTRPNRVKLNGIGRFSVDIYRRNVSAPGHLSARANFLALTSRYLNVRTQNPGQKTCYIRYNSKIIDILGLVSNVLHSFLWIRNLNKRRKKSTKISISQILSLNISLHKAK